MNFIENWKQFKQTNAEHDQISDLLKEHRKSMETHFFPYFKSAIDKSVIKKIDLKNQFSNLNKGNDRFFKIDNINFEVRDVEFNLSYIAFNIKDDTIKDTNIVNIYFYNEAKEFLFKLGELIYLADDESIFESVYNSLVKISDELLKE